MTKQSAIVVVFDRLGAPYLGPYGNTWIETPSFNRLASGSRVWETALAESPLLSQTYQAYWAGIPAICPLLTAREADTLNLWLPSRLEAMGVSTTLITDCPELDELDSAFEFAERMLLPNDVPAELPEKVADTQIGQLVGAAVEWLSKLKVPSLLWLHASAMDGIWDAPLTLRQQFAEAGDPPAAECLLAPTVEFGNHVDYDQLLSLSHAYAGQVCLVDAGLDALLTTVDAMPVDDQPLLIVTAPRGFPLGERGYVGALGDDLYAESVQVPLFVREPGNRRVAQRIPHIARTFDLYTTLLDHFAADHPTPEGKWGRCLLQDQFGTPPCGKEYAWGVHGENVSLRTPIWFLRDAEPAELFAKPDDRWEINEVADRCGDVVDLLRDALHQVQTSAAAADPSQLPTLAHELVAEVD